MRYHLTPVRTANIKKSTNNKNAGEGIKKMEPFYIVGGNASWYSNYGEHGDALKKTRIKTSLTQQSHYWTFTLCVYLLLSRVRLFATPWITASQAPLSMEISGQEYRSESLFPFPPYILRKLQLKKTHVPQCLPQHYLQQLGHGSNLDVHQQVNG